MSFNQTVVAFSSQISPRFRFTELFFIWRPNVPWTEHSKNIWMCWEIVLTVSRLRRAIRGCQIRNSRVKHTLLLSGRSVSQLQGGTMDPLLCNKDRRNINIANCEACHELFCWCDEDCNCTRKHLRFRREQNTFMQTFLRVKAMFAIFSQNKLIPKEARSYWNLCCHFLM